MLKTICTAIIVVSLVGLVSTIFIAIITKIIRHFRYRSATNISKGDNNNNG